MLCSPRRDYGHEVMADAMDIPPAVAVHDVEALLGNPDKAAEEFSVTTPEEISAKYSGLSADALARIAALQARFRGNARRARLAKTRLSSAHAAGGAFAIFGLPDANEQLVTVIQCALGSSSLVGAGNLYVFSKHVGFHRPNGWTIWGPHKAITLLLPLDNVKEVRVKEEYVTAPGIAVRMRNGDEHWFGGMWAPSAASDAVWTAWKARQESRAKLALDTRQMLIATRDTSELTKQEIQIRSLRRCLKDLEDDARSNSDAKVALAKAQMRSEKLKEEIELLSASVTNLAAEHAEQRDLRVAQEAAARELKSRLEDETEQRARFERKVSDLAAECEEHRCRGEELRAHRQAVERRADEARARCVEVERAGEATASGLRVELENQKIEYARTASKLAETTSLLDAERADKASTMAALDTARKQNSAMDADNAILRKKVAVAEECVGEFDAKLVALEAKLIAADAMCATLRKEADVANKKAETFEKDLIRSRGEAERARSAVKEGADEWKEAMAACVAAERDAAAARAAESSARETSDKSRKELEESRARERTAREALADARVRLEKYQSEARESAAAAAEKVSVTGSALEETRTRSSKSEAEATRLAAQLEDANADAERLTDAVERQKQETYYLYTQYANCANQLEETKAALEREQEEVVRLHQSFAASKLALSSAAGSGQSLGGWYASPSPGGGVSAGSVNAPGSFGKENFRDGSLNAGSPLKPPSPDALFPSLGPDAFAKMTPSPAGKLASVLDVETPVSAGGGDVGSTGSPGTPRLASPEAESAAA